MYIVTIISIIITTTISMLVLVLVSECADGQITTFRLIYLPT